MNLFVRNNLHIKYKNHLSSLLFQFHRNQTTNGINSINVINNSDKGTSNKIWRPNNIRMGWSTSVIKQVLPLTSDCMVSKAKAFENIAVGYCNPSIPSNTIMNNDTTTISKTIEDSWLEIILPFSDQPKLRDCMVKRYKAQEDRSKDTILYGRLFEVLDALAADVAYRHCGDIDKFTIVTASIDGFRSFDDSIRISNDLHLLGYLTYVGKSSMEVTIDIVSISNQGKEEIVGKTHFIMVARDPVTNKAKEVNQIILSDPDLIHEFQKGKVRAQGRKERALKSLSVSPPNIDETQFMHQLYLDAKQRKIEKNLIMQGVKNMNIPVLLSDSFKWMKTTEFKSIIMMHSQVEYVNISFII